MYNNELHHVLKEYERIMAKIRPNTKSLIVPHLEDLEYKLRPGMVTLTWTSMNIDGYLHHVHNGLVKLEQLIININDIMENRIENNLKALSKTVLVNLPQEARTFALDEFVLMQEDWIKYESLKLKSKNIEVEGAVEDLIQTICSYNLDKHVEAISADEIQKLSKYYNWSMYQALLHATKYSLNAMKERICGRRLSLKQDLKAFFDVDVQLDGSSCILSPTLEQIQNAINRAAAHVLKSTKNVQNWNQKDVPEDKREPFYDWIAKDKEIVKVILLLTGSIQGTKNNVFTFLESFNAYSKLWSDNVQDSLRKFKDQNPKLEDFEEKLKEFTNIEHNILAISNLKQIGALNLKTDSLKHGLVGWVKVWKESYSKDLHKKAKHSYEDLNDHIKQLQLKLEKPAKDIDSLGHTMHALEEIRKNEASFEQELRPVTEMYLLLETYLPEVMDKEEGDSKNNLQKKWKELVSLGEVIRNELQGKQSSFKKSLIEGIKLLITDVQKLRNDFEKNGPMVSGITPREALSRLRNFGEQYLVTRKKYESFYAGETLFGLPHQEYPALEKTRSEIELLDQLYKLYEKVLETIGKWKEVHWSEIREEIDNMIDQIELFSKACRKLPGPLKAWDAYKELQTEIENMNGILPVVKDLAKKSIKDRHWEEVIVLTGSQIPYLAENFNLSDLLKANLIKFLEDIQDITESADKQMKLEKVLKEEIGAYWESCNLTIVSKEGQMNEPCMIGGNIEEIQEQLDAHSTLLGQYNTQKYVAPFKAEVVERIDQFGEVTETIEKWLKVQVLWNSLVSVFTGGDIAKQMPQEAGIFKKIDKIWKKLMERAYEQKNVIASCTNDFLKQSLPQLQVDLEICQKKLDSYLEQKRNMFPRFYFCSDTILLKILSQGQSDPNQIQEFLENLFDAVGKVKFHEFDKRAIVQLLQMIGQDEEKVDLKNPVKAEGLIENWLCVLEREMQVSVREICRRGARDFMTPDLAVLQQKILDYQSQVALLGIQIIWTTKVEEAINKHSKERTPEMEKKRKDITAIMTLLSAMCLMDLNSKVQRCKVETLVTVHVHQRDIFQQVQEDAKANKLQNSNDFDWSKNTRICWNNEKDQIVISVTDVDFIYSYEFLGAKERLCITPLTDRCYVTLAQALSMLYGGAPAGPAGTGKTETVKDMGRCLGIFVVVTNCSGEHKYRDMAKIYKGVCQSGLWGCFDEFNRISLATLSVVAAQIEAITTAKKSKLTRFQFPEEKELIKLIPSCGYFITMNPGYAGRQELPENLKVLFRSVSMMMPDRQIIMKTKLASVGYNTYEELACKFHNLYRLCEGQLSKQRHYDFGLRNILSVLRTAGNTKREELSSSEEMLLCRTLRDMNLSKLVADDIPLFQSLLNDIFPKQKGEIPGKVYKAVDDTVTGLIKSHNLECKPSWKLKIIQLYETKLVRHGFMLVGKSGCGKTTIANMLTQAMTENGETHKIIKMNPKAFTGQDMYGVMNNTTNEWTQGIFSNIWQKCNNRNNKFNSWITCDGPVDAIWIENLNTVLDDNKILTLANADRFPMTDNVRMVFEVENLNNASPATVSRCGIVYVSETDLSWDPLFFTWNNDRGEDKITTSPEEPDYVRQFVKKYFWYGDDKIGIFDLLTKQFNYVMITQPVVRVTMFLNILTANLTMIQQKGIKYTKVEFEKIFVYCLAWSIGGLFESEEREKLHKLLETIGAPLPNITNQKMGAEKETVFDFYINFDTMDWKQWEAATWNIPKRLEFSQLLIPTMDSTRAQHIITLMDSLDTKRNIKRKEDGIRNTLLVGGPGTAKTSVILMYLSGFKDRLQKMINFSSATTPKMFQESIEGELVKKNAKTYHPDGGKRMTVFIDDCSMPQVNEWGDQETLEITRQLIEQKGLYFLNKDQRGDLRIIEQLQYLACMNHPGGGRNDIPNRIKRHFYSINMTSPSQKSIENIYGRILETLFNPKKYSPDVINTKNIVVDATIHLWNIIKRRLLPTPAKFHYVFNMRELSRTFQGICAVAGQPEHQVIMKCLNVQGQCTPEFFLMMLWRHECERVFEDKLVTADDKQVFHSNLDKVTIEKFKELFSDKDEDELKTNQYFADFQRKDIMDEYGEIVDEAPFVYEAVKSLDDIRRIIYEKMKLYNEKNPSKQLGLVIFDDACKHLLRIARIINTPRASALLVGVGGSGKQSLTRLSSSICKQLYTQIVLIKGFSLNNLREIISVQYDLCGPGGKSVSFILTDAEIKDESFLELFNSFLATGEVSGMLNKESKDSLALRSKPVMQKELNMKKTEDPSTQDLWNFCLNRVRDCLHIVLSFSPVGPKFRERARKFPALFSTPTIDWFMPWPEEALVSVAQNFIGKFEIDTNGNKQTVKQLEIHMGKVHQMVTDVCGIYYERMRRQVFVTPKSYLSFINMYKQVYIQKYEELNKEESNIRKGLKNVDEARKDIGQMQKKLEVEKKEQAIAAEQTNKLLDKLKVENEKAAKKEDEVNKVKSDCEAEKAKIIIEKEEAYRELAAALPFQEAAIKAGDSLDVNQIKSLRALKTVPDAIRLVVDAVILIFNENMDPVKIKEATQMKNKWLVVQDSFDNVGKNLTRDEGFVKKVQDFTKNDKDKITDETCELLEPYLFMRCQPSNELFFTATNLATTNQAIGSLTVWARAMYDYHNASKIVKPKQDALFLKEAALNVALNQLAQAEAELEKVQKIKAELQAQFEEANGKAKALEEQAQKTKRDMDRANKLITGLGDNIIRWNNNAAQMANLKLNLVGDVAKGCAFVSYCGPFNSEFRDKLIDEYFFKDLREREIPCSLDLDLTRFLVEPEVAAKWSQEGLPKDQLSIQNAIMVTKSSRYPLLIDPQGQAGDWIKRREVDMMSRNLIYNINNPKLKDLIKFPIEEGIPVLIEGIENEVDPLFDPILEKQWIIKGRKIFLDLGGGEKLELIPTFQLYMTTRLSNPKFSPELAAKATIIDFTVTQGGLEQQLLSRVLSKEQKSLEEQMQSLQEEITFNTNTLRQYDKDLLLRLSNAEGSLIEDVQLIEVLGVIKSKEKEVNQKLKDADEKKIEIDEKREQFRPIAARGSVLYFCIVEMINVNWMYNTSLQQFIQLFEWSIDNAAAAPIQKDRVNNIIEKLTFKVYQYISRGLFERDKVTFKLMVSMKIQIKAGLIEQKDVQFFLKAGSALEDRNNPFSSWGIDQKQWLNLKALSQHRFGNSHSVFFKDIIDRITRAEPLWKKWVEEDNPESAQVPDIHDKIQSETIHSFIHLCLVRCLREDRTKLVADMYIEDVLGPEYVRPISDSIQSIWEESKNNLPVLYLLSAGADPTQAIDEFAKKKKKFPCMKTSMGEEQDKFARKQIADGFIKGTWVILQNCHLGLEFMAMIEEILQPKDDQIHEEFRLWITCEPIAQFPLSLLQLAIKVTTEPPKGIQAGLFRTYSTMVNQDFLEKVEPLEKWRSTVFAICFLHSIVQERRKFGALGFCIAYEFNYSDLEASLNYAEKHFTFCGAQSSTPTYSWKAIKYITCEVMYGGRITDDEDRELFKTYGEHWIGENLFTPNYKFSNLAECIDYQIPQESEHIKFIEYIQNVVPNKDNPLIFGLHPNSDLTFRLKESIEMINTLVDTQPKEGGSSSGKSPEAEIQEKIRNEMIKDIPENWNFLELMSNLDRMKSKVLGVAGLAVPLNVFLKQELERFQVILTIVRTMLLNICDAIDGTIIMTPEIVSSIEAMFQYRVPQKWVYDPTGAEISWLVPSLGGWIKNLKDRYYQLNNWYANNTRPTSFWLSGFLNPEGFLTGVKQEVCRSVGQKASLSNPWSLENVFQSIVVKSNEVIETTDGRVDKPQLQAPAEGVYIHGLFLEGAGWDRKQNKLCESEPKKLYFTFPIIHVSATGPQEAGVLGMKKADDKNLEKGIYICPVYKYPRRNDKYLVTRFSLKGEGPQGNTANAYMPKGMKSETNWRLKGVTLLCSKE